MMRRLLQCLLFGLLVAALPAGSANPPPVRVAVLLPWVEDALGRVPERASVVATVRRSLHQPVSDGRIDLGNPHSPSFERLAEARPQLVIGDASVHAGLREKLGRSGGEVLLVPTASVDETFDSLVTIGRRIGAETEMRGAVAEARSSLEALSLEEPVPTLALFGAPGTFYAVTRRAWLGDLLERLNFENLSDVGAESERFPGLVPLNDEWIATLEPEVVLLVTHGDPERIRTAFLGRVSQGGPWRSVRESAAGGIHVLDPRIFTANPGLALPVAARELVALAPSSSGDAPAVSAAGVGEP